MMYYKNLALFFVLGSILVVSSVSAQNAALASIDAAQTAQRSIVGTTAVSTKYRTLTEIMKVTGFEELLDGSAPFTIFAPSELAFDDFNGKAIKRLLASGDKEELKSLLGYHIVAGKLSASKILKALCRGKGRTTFTTVQGDLITATMQGIDIILSDSFGNTSTIVVADANQRNGVIHEVNAMIRPGKD